MIRNLQIAIAGCGVGGLATAALLREQGHEVTIFDQFAAPKPVGSALIIQPTGQDVLAQIGVLKRAVSLGKKITRLEGRRAEDERLVLDASYSLRDPSRFGLAIHRGALFEVLFEAAQSRGVKIETNSQVLSIDRPSDPYLRIEGGGEAGPFDLVIDAMGAKSTGTPLLPSELAYGALWGVVDLPPEAEDLPNVLRQRYRQARQMAGILPIGSLPRGQAKKAAVFWSMRVDEYQEWLSRDLDDWRAEAYELWPEFEYFVSGMTRHNQLTFATYSHGSLNRLYQGLVAYVGDSAHQSSPQLGQGANHALLDAAALADAVARKDDVGKALSRYSRSRMVHLKTYQALSAVFTPMYQSNSGVLARLRDWVLAPLMRIWPVRGIVSRLVSGDLVRPFRPRKTRNAASKIETIAEPGE